MAQYREKGSEVLPGLLIVVSVLIFFSEILYSGKTLFGSDFILQFYPWKKFVYDYIQSHGSLPLWNPYQFAGTPFIANIQASMFYPFGFLFYLMPTKQAYGYTIVLHCILGATFMYAFARSLTINKPGAFIAAIVFTYNGFFMGHLYAGHLTFVQNYIWIPLIFFCVHNFLKAYYFRYAMLAGLFLGIQILGGFPQIAFYTILAIILFAAYHIAARLKHGQRNGLIRLTGGIVIIVLSGFTLAAVQLLPTYEFTQLSTRAGGVTYEFATSDSFDPVNFITFLVPNFFGNPANGSYWKSPEYWQFWELCGYVGIGPLLLLGFLKNETQARHVRTFFVLLLLLSLFLSLGRYNPLYRFIYHFPGFNNFRIPAQIVYLYVFSVSLLAGMGLKGVTQCESYSNAHKMIVGVGTLFFGLLTLIFFLWPAEFYSYLFKIVRSLGLTSDLMPLLHKTMKLALFTGAGLFTLLAALIHLRLTNRLSPNSLVLAMLLVTIVDLWSFSNPLIRATDLQSDQDKIDCLKALYNDQEIYRVVTTGSLFGPNEGVLYGYQDIHGYDPLILKRYLEYINKSQNMNIGPQAVSVRYVTRLKNHLIRMLNVKYRIPDDRRVVQSELYLPRAFIVHDALTLPQEKVLDFMMTHDFNPEEVVIFEESQQTDGLFPHATAPTGNELNHAGEDDILGSSPEHCHILEYSTNEIKLAVRMNNAGYLVLSELYYPGWKAYINGKRTKILAGNYIFRVLPLSKGEHNISMKFEPGSFTIGLIISTAYVLFLLVFGFSLLVRRKR